MRKKVTQKEIASDLSTYGKVEWTGGSGKQFVLPFNWRGEPYYSFQFLIFAYGKKSNVVKKLVEVLNNNTDEEIEKMDFVKNNSKVPLSLRGGTGLNCF